MSLSKVNFVARVKTLLVTSTRCKIQNSAPFQFK